MHAAQEVQSVANLDDIRVVTVDSRNERRHVMRRLLELCVDQAEIGEADSREAAVELVGRCRPEVVVLEIAMPLDEGLGTITALIEMAQAKGEVRAGDARLHAFTLMGPMLMGIIYRETLEPVGGEPLDFGALASQHAETVLTGLLKEKAQ